MDRLSSRLATPALSARSHRSNASNASSATTSIFSVPFVRDPRAFPLAGASKEHEQLHRQIHDDAAGARISWWLRQRDKSNEYAKSKGMVVGGPSIAEGFSEDMKHRHRRRHSKDKDSSKVRIAEQMTKAFAGAAGRRSSDINEPKEPVLKDVKDPAADSFERKEAERMRQVLAKIESKAEQRQMRQRQMVNAQPEGAIAGDRREGSQRKRRATGAAAAGKKCMGSQPRTEGIKVHPSGQVCEVDQVICGRDISASPQKLKEHLSREEFQGAAGKKCLGDIPRTEGLKTNVAHATFSQIDEVVFGHDMDNSIGRTQTHLEDPAFHGAAGRRYVGHVHKAGGMKQHPAKTITHADTIIQGRDLGHSEERVKELQHLEAFKDAAGSQSLGHQPRREGLKSNFVPGISQVDEIVFGNPGSSEDHDHLQPEEFQGAAGRKCIGQQEAPGGMRKSHMAHVTTVDKIAFGHHVDNAHLDAHLHSPHWTGAAGRKYVGAEARAEGRQAVLGGLSQVDEIVWGHDIDRSNEKLRLKELERLKAIGCSSAR